MKNGAKVAVAVAAGYYFGRHRKLRLAAALAAAGVAGVRGRKGGLLGQGIKVLDSPELEELADRLRNELREAGRTAAKAAAGRPINALSDIIHERAETLRHPEEHAKAAAAQGAKAAETVGKVTGARPPGPAGQEDARGRGGQKTPAEEPEGEHEGSAAEKGDEGRATGEGEGASGGETAKEGSEGEKTGERQTATVESSAEAGARVSG